jgi:hypothetical protein
MGPQRRPDPNGRVRPVEICSEQAYPAHQLLNRGTAGHPGFVDLVILAQHPWGGKMYNDYWLQMQGIAGHHQLFRPPSGSCRCLWYRLSSFVDKSQPIHYRPRWEKSRSKEAKVVEITGITKKSIAQSASTPSGGAASGTGPKRTSIAPCKLFRIVSALAAIKASWSWSTLRNTLALVPSHSRSAHREDSSRAFVYPPQVPGKGKYARKRS